MKTETNLSYVRSRVAVRPTQEEVELAKEKANKLYQSSLGRAFEHQIYTR